MRRIRLSVGVLLLLVACTAIGQSLPGNGVKNTRHDARTWFRSVEVCNICHAPHTSSTVYPLWNHSLTMATYTLYGSSTMNAIVGQPGSVSKLCLSCHDGTLAINDFVGHTGATPTTKLSGGKNYMGTDLSNDHPVGITYDTALAASDGALFDPATKNVTIGSVINKTGTIAATMLVDGKVECTSCHDVHNIYTVGITKALIKVDLAGSAICLVCHNK